MLRSHKCLFLVAILGTLISGCTTPKSFLDPGYPKVTYDDVKKRTDPLRLKLMTEFRRNGKHLPQVDVTLQDHVERLLRASGVIIPAPDGPDGEINIVLNDTIDPATALTTGQGTALALGLAEPVATDKYNMDVTLTRDGKTRGQYSARHAVHSISDKAVLPAGLEGLPPLTAFSRALDQMLLYALQQMQKNGEL